MRTPIVSWFCQKMRCIAVERPQDLAKPGVGKLQVLTKTMINGVGTQFKKDIIAGDTLKFLGTEVSNINTNSYQIPEQLVESVVSDTELIVKAPGIIGFDISQEFNFKVIPKLDQTHVYEAVIERLIKGQSLGIFPEGGSHDRTELLPIKAGVSLMALGAMARDPKCQISIVACGLKYFKPQKFRSQVIVEFSRPYRITNEVVEKYKKNKREACGEMLMQVEKKMREVTLNAPSYKELKQVYMARDIYMPKKKDQNAEQMNEIQKRFLKGFTAYRSHPELKTLLEEIEDYIKELKAYNVRDSEVKNLKINFCKIFMNLMVILPKLLINLVFVSSKLIIPFRVLLV